jgi:hypothetical protein
MVMRDNKSQSTRKESFMNNNREHGIWQQTSTIGLEEEVSSLLARRMRWARAMLLFSVTIEELSSLSLFQLSVQTVPLLQFLPCLYNTEQYFRHFAL